MLSPNIARKTRADVRMREREPGHPAAHLAAHHCRTSHYAVARLGRRAPRGAAVAEGAAQHARTRVRVRGVSGEAQEGRD
ncbi:hypothetical protein Ntsu_63830 [Nocardia sp. IFM 10818]